MDYNPRYLASLPPMNKELCSRCMGTGQQENQHQAGYTTTSQCFACRGTGVIEYETKGEIA